MFDRASRPTITELVVESADSTAESADYWSRPTGNWPSGYGPLGKQMAKRTMKIHQDTLKIFMFWYQETLYELFILLERKSL